MQNCWPSLGRTRNWPHRFWPGTPASRQRPNIQILCWLVSLTITRAAVSHMHARSMVEVMRVGSPLPLHGLRGHGQFLSVCAWGSKNLSQAIRLLAPGHISGVRLLRNRRVQYAYNQWFIVTAGMAKLADAADLKSAGPKRPVGVRFPLPAPAWRTLLSMDPNGVCAWG